jgi:excisionase family DNA binding protein
MSALDDLPRLVQDADPSALPSIIGVLETVKAVAWSRLTSPLTPPAASAEDHLLTMPEVAERLGIKEHQAREMGRRKELPVVTVGLRRVRVSARALDEWIAVRRSGTLRPTKVRC